MITSSAHHQHHHVEWWTHWVADVSGGGRVGWRMRRAVDASGGGCVGWWTRWVADASGGGRVGLRMCRIVDALDGGWWPASVLTTEITIRLERKSRFASNETLNPKDPKP